MKADFLASCYGKIQFDTYADAKVAAEDLGSKAHAYKCRYTDKGIHYHRGRRQWRK